MDLEKRGQLKHRICISVSELLGNCYMCEIFRIVYTKNTPKKNDKDEDTILVHYKHLVIQHCRIDCTWIQQSWRLPVLYLSCPCIDYYQSSKRRTRRKKKGKREGGRRKEGRQEGQGRPPKATTEVAFLAYPRGHICSHPRRLPGRGFLMIGILVVEWLHEHVTLWYSCYSLKGKSFVC